jgi:nitroreductase
MQLIIRGLSNHSAPVIICNLCYNRIYILYKDINMDTYEAIAARHSIREFSDQSLPKQMIEKLIQAGFSAPSNNHLRQWHFVILDDLTQRQTILEAVIHPLDRKGSQAVINRWGMTDPIQREMYLEAIPLQFSMLMNAGTLILPFFSQPSPLLHPKSLSDLNAFASIWCCIENILISAASEGIFGVTRIPFEAESKFVKTVLHIPVEYEFPCWLALGYPAPQAKKAKQISIDTANRIHYNNWPE